MLARDSECAINPGLNTSGLLVPECYIPGLSTGLDKAQRFDSSLRANWLSCFWPGVNGGLPDRGVWCHWEGRNDIWYQSFGPNMDAGRCQRLWTCRHVLICADVCWHVPTCVNTLSTCETNHFNLIQVPTSWDVLETCPYVLICTTWDITFDTSDTNHLDLIWMLASVGTCGHADMCWYVLTCADICGHSQSLWDQWFWPY